MSQGAADEHVDRCTRAFVLQASVSALALQAPPAFEEGSLWETFYSASAEQRETAREIERILRRVLAEYGPAKAPLFQAPVSAREYPNQVQAENRRVDRMVQERESLLAAMARLDTSEEVLALVPPSAHEYIRRARALLSLLPNE